MTVCESHKKINGKFGSLRKNDDVAAINDDIQSQGSESDMDEEEMHQSDNNMTVQSQANSSKEKKDEESDKAILHNDL